MKARRNITTMRVEEIDALLGGEAQRLSDQYREMPLEFMDGYGWAVTQICRLFHDETPVIKCKDCRYHEGKQCSKWRDKTVVVLCETDDEGYCYMAERKEHEID